MAPVDKKKSDTTPAPDKAILESISDGVFTVDAEWHITFFNRAAETITGVSRTEALGRQCCDVFRSSLCGDNCALKQTLDSGKPVIGQSAWIIDADGNRIPISLSTAVLRDTNGVIIGGAETFRDLSEIEALRQELEEKYRAGDMTSRSPVMQRIFEVLPAIAESPSTVLILGETGTGKELLARTIHSLSHRNSGPFVTVNCGAIPDTLLESELFGYKSGAFTGAVRDKPGRFALAQGGTLFLDEIGEISSALQISLLRVLQERTFEPLGSVRTETTDARIITATNKDLAEHVKHKHFREDLYYRVNVVRIELPPLRNRKEDIPMLANQFIARNNRLQNKSVQGLTTDALSLFMAYDWPGNIRELENVIERAFVLCKNNWITLSHLPAELISHKPQTENQTHIHATRNLVETRLITAALHRNDGNRVKTAKELGIHKTTLYRKMKKLGIA
jgi:PAS domain S-box-containing protein